MVGGSTTSLLSVLSEIDYSEYNVDLLLLSQKGKLFDLIPKQVNILPFAMENCEGRKFKLKKLFSAKSMFNLLYAVYQERRSKNTNVRSQIMQRDTLRYCKPLKKEYDVAISYLEGWALYYVASKTKAKKKIAWIHLDYLEARLKPEIDNKFLTEFDNIVLVSDTCKEHFDHIFPSYKEKTLVIENLLSQKVIQRRSKEDIKYSLPMFQKKKLRFVSTCRIVFYHKGIDRGLDALRQILEKNLLPDEFAWYIIGTGQDAKKLTDLIKRYGLSDYIFWCGEHINPLPLVCQCHMFFLPSRYEGKPMAVTEAQMLGVLPIVTNYSSAKEQIENGTNGLIIDNSDEAIYQFFINLFKNPESILTMQSNVAKYNYSNLDEFKKIIGLIEGK